MRVRTTVGQVAIAGGEQYEAPGGILVEEPTSRFGRGRSRGNLYVLIQVSGPEAGRDALAGQLARIVRDVYYSQRGSITAGLQKAIRGVNGVLFDENRNSLPGEQRTAGVTCMVLRDDDLFIAQGGPAAAYLAQDGQVTRFPDLSPWLDDVSEEELDAAPLGSRREAHVDLFHAQVRHGDVALAADAGLAAGMAPERWPDILAAPSAAGLLGEVVAAGKGDDLLALVVRMAEEEAVAPAAPPPEPQSTPQAAAAPAWNAAVEWLEQLRLGERLQAAGRGLLAALAGLGALFLTLFQRMIPDRSQAQPAERGQKDTVSPTESRTNRSRGAKAESRAHGGLVQKLLIVVAVAIPIVVAVVVLVVVLQKGQTQRAELEALRQGADLSWQQANATSDPAQARAYLVEAEGYLTQLTTLRPEDAAAAELQKKVEARLDEINQVRRISWIGELAQYPSNADLTRVVVEGAHVFVMDREAGQVYHHQLDEFQQALKPETVDNVLVSKGQQVGGVLVADLVDMVWVPVGEGRQKANLVILESGGNLLEYDPTTGELVPLRVAGTDAWQFPSLVGSYYGRFYVLDSTANKIWRYQPTLDGYSAPPDDWLQAQVDLLGVVDMAIGNSIFLLYADGRMQKLTAGQPDAFDISDWDAPPRSPSALFARPPEETQWVYVADRGNNRIVQCGKDGKFKRQFQMADAEDSAGPDPLGGVTSLFVDEISGHAFFLSGQKLYLIILPD